MQRRGQRRLRPRRLVLAAICTICCLQLCAESSEMPVTKEDVIERLKTIKGPDFEGDIVSLGLVSDIFIADAKVFFSITVPAARAKELEPLRAAAERVVKEMPGVAGAMVALTAEKKGGGMAAPVPQRPAAPAARPAPAGSACRGAWNPRGQARRAGHRSDHRGRFRQGRGRQVDDRRQHRAWSQRKWPQGGRSGRRHLRPVDAASPEHPWPPADGRWQSAEADGELRAQGHVDGIPRRRGDADDLARTDGDVGAHPDAARGRMGRRSTYWWSTCRLAPATLN